MSSSPATRLRERLRTELSASFVPNRPIVLATAPGRLDVMGGILHAAGGVVFHAATSAGVAIAVQARDDRSAQLFSFNEFDANRPFTLNVPIDALARSDAASLRADWTADAGRRWAAALAGPLAAMHAGGHVDLADASLRGVNVAVLSDLPPRTGLASSTAAAIAASLGLAAVLDRTLSPAVLAAMARDVQQRFAGRHASEADALGLFSPRPGTWTRMRCNAPTELLPALPVPAGMRIVGITTGVRQAIAEQQFDRLRIAAHFGRRVILEQIRQMAADSGRQLVGDPMRGQLANLDHDSYRTLFRPRVPEFLLGSEGAARFGEIANAEPAWQYAVRHATDHFVLEARRATNFGTSVANANAIEDRSSRARGLEIDKAGHLMYASHLSYANDAMLSCDEADLLVDLVRRRERQGLYGARISAAGGGGTVVVLCEASAAADAALADIIDVYAKQTGRVAQLVNADGRAAGVMAMDWPIC